MRTTIDDKTQRDYDGKFTQKHSTFEQPKLELVNYIEDEAKYGEKEDEMPNIWTNKTCLFSDKRSRNICCLINYP